VIVFARWTAQGEHETIGVFSRDWRRCFNWLDWTDVIIGSTHFTVLQCGWIFKSISIPKCDLPKQMVEAREFYTTLRRFSCEMAGPLGRRTCSTFNSLIRNSYGKTLREVSWLHGYFNATHALSRLPLSPMQEWKQISLSLAMRKFWRCAAFRTVDLYPHPQRFDIQSALVVLFASRSVINGSRLETAFSEI
jgi:hypothetical protein